MATEPTAAEHGRAAELARDDARLTVALRCIDTPLFATLAGGAQLIRRWAYAPPAARALIAAGIDARRIGITRPLPADLLHHKTILLE